MSKPVPVLLGLLIALLAGGAAGYVIGAQGQGTPPATTAPDSARTPAPQPSPQAPEQAPPASSPDAAAPGGLAGWLATLADEKPRPGTGRILGRVATADGRGIAGITVSAAAQYPHKWRNTPDVPLEEIVEDTARRTHFQRAGISRAQTDGDGRYELTSLGDYEYLVTAKGPGYTCASREHYRPARPDLEVNFTATPVGRVELDVLMPDGSTPAEANIDFESKTRGGRGERWKPSERTFEVPTGKMTVSATCGAHRQFIADPQEIECREGDPPLKLMLQLKVVPGILCQVTLPPDFARHWLMRVGVMRDPPAEQPAHGTREFFENNRRLDDATETAFAKLEAGRYRVAVLYEDRIMASTDVQLGQEFRTVRLVVPEPDVKDYIVVRVKAPDGTPAQSAHVNVSMTEGDYGGSLNRIVLHRGERGIWVFRSKPEGREAREGKPWKYIISASATEYGSVSAEYPPEATHELELRFPTPASLTIHLPGATSHTLRARLQPMLWRVEGSKHSLLRRAIESETLDAEVFKVEGLNPGKYEFSLELKSKGRRMEFEDGGGEVARWSFELAAGENTQTFSIPALYRLTLVVPDPKAVSGLRIQPVREGDGRSPYTSDIRERMVFEALPAGEWLVTTDDGEMKFNLASDAEFKLNLRTYDCFLLNIETAGKITELGLRAGDKLIRVDGQEFGAAKAFYKILSASVEKDSTTWTLIRAGGQIDVTFSGKALAQIMQESKQESFRPNPGFRD